MPEMSRQFRYREALKQLSDKMGLYKRFIDAYSKYALKQDRRTFDNYVLPWLWANYDINRCPPWTEVPELQPDHWPTSKPLKQPTEPQPSPWNQKDTQD